MEALYKIFMESPHREYVKKILATPMAEDMNQLYQGFQSLPKPFKHGKGFEVKIWSTNGSIATPFYGKKIVREYYKEDKDFHIVLELPFDIKTKLAMDPSTLSLNSKPKRRRALTNQ